MFFRWTSAYKFSIVNTYNGDEYYQPGSYRRSLSLRYAPLVLSNFATNLTIKLTKVLTKMTNHLTTWLYNFRIVIEFVVNKENNATNNIDNCFRLGGIKRNRMKWGFDQALLTFLRGAGFKAYIRSNYSFSITMLKMVTQKWVKLLNFVYVIYSKQLRHKIEKLIYSLMRIS